MTKAEQAALDFQRILINYGAQIEPRDARWFEEPKNIFSRAGRIADLEATEEF